MHALWVRVGDRIAEKLGLHFPRERRDDLERGLSRACKDLGFPDGTALAHWLLSDSPTPSQWTLLASHLTIGETYFFREKSAFEFLRSEVLPRILVSRGLANRRVRLWSAGCCTGEEAYSLAMTVRQAIPDLANCNVTILATDINERFLQRAHAGIYRDWSFRESLAGIKQQHFESLPGGEFAIHSEIKRQVTFANLNLVEDNYPSITTDTNAMDVIFCRNVLMYFTPEQARKVIAKMHRALVDGGWLVVSAVEGSARLFPDFRPSDFPGIAAYQKLSAVERRARSSPPVEETASEWPLPPQPPLPPLETSRVVANEPDRPAPISASTAEQEASAADLFTEGRYSEAAELLLAAPEQLSTPVRFSLLAQSLANLGRLSEALTWCDRWVALDKLNPASHYLRAMTLQELGEIPDARQSLQRAIYLQPEMVAAHFALGNLARSEEKSSEAARHFDNALRFLRTYEPDAVLPEAGGLTAGRLKEIITSISVLETTR